MKNNNPKFIAVHFFALHWYAKNGHAFTLCKHVFEP